MIRKYNRLIVLFVCLFFLVSELNGQSLTKSSLTKSSAGNKSQNAIDYVSTYRKAVYYFENNDYGKCLTYAEDAITKKKERSEYEGNIIKKSLTSKAVKSAGDNLLNIIKVLESRNEDETVALIKGYLKLKGEEFFDNSMKNILNYIEENSDYPEAQFLIGKIYKIEGEYSVAENYFLLAYENRNVLDIPDEKYEILYTLAEISKLQNDYEKYEARLLNIIIDDVSSNDEALKKSFMYTIQSNKEDSMEKFFNLYRAYDFNSLKAYILLTDYYLENNYLDKALLYSSFSVLTGFTKIYDVLSARNGEFTYTNFSNYLEEINNHKDIVDWGIDNEYWKSFNQLADISKMCGYDKFAKSLLSVLVKKSPQEYWQKKAVLQLSNFN